MASSYCIDLAAIEDTPEGSQLPIWRSDCIPEDLTATLEGAPDRCTWGCVLFSAANLNIWAVLRHQFLHRYQLLFGQRERESGDSHGVVFRVRKPSSKQPRLAMR